jgi:hypothetical protein
LKNAGKRVFEKKGVGIRASFSNNISSPNYYISIKKILVNLIIMSVFEFSLKKSGLKGNYRCSGFAIPNFNVTKDLQSSHNVACPHPQRAGSYNF